ncbi:MAG TPA: hypothetical protein VMV88_02160, partial [Gallionella sp.]|nr:hypothetical protein [Gallionella sp.]
MEYNPFTQEYNRLSTIINELNNKKSLLTDELDWFDSINISDLNFQLDSQIAAARNYESIKANVRNEIIALNDSIKTIKKSIKSRLNPFNFFDKEQILLRSQLEELKLNLCNK